MYQLIQTDSFKKRFRRFIRQHPELLPRYRKTILILSKDPFHPSLRLHALQGRLKGLYSVSLNMNYRITLELEIEGRLIKLINIGSHEEVYR